MKSVWRHWGKLFVRQLRNEGTANASLMSAGALRALRFPREHVELFDLELFDRYVLGPDDANPLFHLSHRHYLSTSFSWRERVGSVLFHHRFEDRRYGRAYKEAVYRRGGIDLWVRHVDATRYALRLRATTDLRHEGGLSVVLCADGQVLCEMSYAWVAGELLGLEGCEPVPFITRNQSIHRDAPALQRFRQAFPQNSPMYFCLAAVHGLVLAHGIRRVAGIRADRQVAFEERYASGFRHSYCDFWRSFGAVEAGGIAHLMQVPLALPPIASIPAKHRKRAAERRGHWAEIARLAREAIEPHLLDTERGDNGPPRSSLAGSMMEMHATLLLMASFGA